MLLSLAILLGFIIPPTDVSSKQVANYTIEVTFSPKSKTLDGKQILEWTNTSDKPVTELHFHTYLNAFKDEKSTFMRESYGKLRSDKMDKGEKENYGNIKINSIKLNNTIDLSNKTSFIQPDDLNVNDQTVMRVMLPKAILPNETIQLNIDFTSKLPKIFARTGWAADDYFFVGQWFPKIGVLEKDGTWNCHQFHANTEFYSNFGKYKVNITLPKAFVVAGTGAKVSETIMKGGIKTLVYEAHDVHDFAWTASPHFIESHEDYKGIKLMVFMQPEHKNMSDRYFESAKNSIDYMQKHVGKYPHSTLSMIDPSLDGSGSGGMEYPTLITCGTSWGTGKWVRFQELVTIHEFVHQYFQGIIATNEFENSWMDEGFTQYFEGRIMDKYYKKGSVLNFLGFTINDASSSRDSYVSMRHPDIAPILMYSWKYPKGSYPVLTYTKPATVLKTLENLLGEDVIDEIFKTYYERFKFKHPTPDDFFSVANEIAAKSTQYKSLDWFFDQTIREAKVCDYTVLNLKNKDGKSSFELKNLQNMKIPTTVLIHFRNGENQTMEWDGNSQVIKLDKEIKSVSIDPERKNWMDINMVNNSISVEPPISLALKYTAKFIFWMQNVFFMV